MKSPSPVGPRRTPISLFACAACALGLLLWARLLLVSHPPRIATAEPQLRTLPGTPPPVGSPRPPESARPARLGR